MQTLWQCQVIVEATVPIKKMDADKLEQKHFIKMKKRCRVAYGLKKNENKGDVEFTLSQKKTSETYSNSRVG